MTPCSAATAPRSPGRSPSRMLAVAYAMRIPSTETLVSVEDRRMTGKTEAVPPAPPPPASPRRRELLAATRAYAAQNNLSDLSLRPLAAAIGSSPRVLLYLFGSKEGLIREVLAAGRTEQLALVEQ